MFWSVCYRDDMPSTEKHFCFSSIYAAKEVVYKKLSCESVNTWTALLSIFSDVTLKISQWELTDLNFLFIHQQL